MLKNLRSSIFRCLLYPIIIITISSSDSVSQTLSGLSGKLIVLDPGHGGSAATDSYRQGPTGEREEWIDLRVAILLKDLLEQKGAKVLLTRATDTTFPLAERSRMAVENKADFFISIHHNATADPSVNFPIIYYHGLATENEAGVKFGKLLGKALQKHMYKSKTPVSVVSDFTIFSGAGASVLRGSYGIPGVLAEASFFTNPEEESRLKTKEHNFNEALAFVEALEKFFRSGIPRIREKDVKRFPPQFATLQEADRMSDVAKRWKQDYEEAKKLMKNKDSDSLQKAYDLFTQSARSFPDSYVARDCHRYGARLLKKLGRETEAEQERIRVREFYPN